MSDLQNELGLEEPSSPECASTEQAQQLKDRFEPPLADIDECLSYTVANAPQAEHDKFVSRRDDAIQQYQQTLDKIDPEDESVAASAVSQTCECADGLAHEAAEFKRQTEEALCKWQAREPELDEALGKVDELESWRGNPNPNIRQGADAVRTLADERRYEEAVTELDKFLAELNTCYEEYERQMAAQVEYEQNLAAIESQLASTLDATYEPVQGQDPTCGDGVQDVHREIESTQGEMENAAYNEDFLMALELMNKLPPLCEQYAAAVEAEEERILAEAKAQFEANLSTIQDDLDTALAETASDNELDCARDPLVSTHGEMEVAASNEDYVAATEHLDKLPALLETFFQALEEYEKRIKREQFEQILEPLQPALDSALDPEGMPQDEHDGVIQELHEKIKGKNSEMESAVASEDYDAALARLEELSPLVEQFHEEKGKTERTCTWILGVCTSLTSDIMSRYLNASTKINNAANFYDEALKDFNAAISAVDEKKKLAADLLAGVFFAALGGGVGAAAGAALAKTFSDVAKEAMVDATKKVIDYTGALAAELGKPKSNPGAGLASVGGSGVELARNVGNQINQQGELLLQEVKALSDLVVDNSDKCIDDGTLRVAGDPRDAMKGDPILSALGDVANATKQAFARSLWHEWINSNAFSLREMEVCYSGPGWGGPCITEGYYVDDSAIDGFFAWWGDLKDNIVRQTGDDFGLQAKIDEARRLWEELAEEKEAELDHVPN